MPQLQAKSPYAPLITAFGALMRKYNMYPPGHAVVEQGLNQVMLYFQRYFERMQTLAIGIGSDRLYIEDTELLDDDWMGSFISVLHQYGVTQIKFQRGLTRDNMSIFFETLSVDPLTAAEAGGYKELLLSRGVTSIDIAVIDYKLREEDFDHAGAEQSDAEIWKRLARSWQGGDGEDRQRDVAFAKDLLANAVRLSHALNSAFSTKGRAADAGNFANSFLEMVSTITPDPRTTDADTMGAFQTQLQRVMEGTNPKAMYFLLEKMAVEATTPAGKGGPAMPGAIDRVAPRKLARGIMKGYDPKNGNVGELGKVYQEFVGTGREKSILSEIRNLVFDTDNKHDVSLVNISKELEEMALADPKLRRLQQTLANAAQEQNAREQTIRAVLEEHFRKDDPDVLVDFDPARIQDSYCRNLLTALDMVQKSESYALYAKNLDTMIADLIRSQQISLAYSMVQTLSRHAANPNENSVSCRTARQVLLDLQQESLAEDLIAAEHDLGKEHGAQIRDLLIHMGPAAFEPIVNALETESDRNARMFLLGILQEGGLQVADLIRNKLQHPDWHMVRNMINLLIKLQPKDLLDSLELTVEHPEPKVRKEVVKALTSAQGPRAVPLLAKLIHDPDESVRHQAIINLGQFKTVDAAAPLLIEALRPKDCFDGDVQAEELAIRSLGSLKAPEAAEVLEKYVTNVHFYQRPDEELVALAAKCLTMLGDGAGLAVLEKGAKSWNAMIKRICKKSLADVRAREGN